MKINMQTSWQKICWIQQKDLLLTVLLPVYETREIRTVRGDSFLFTLEVMDALLILGVVIGKVIESLCGKY